MLVWACACACVFAVAPAAAAQTVPAVDTLEVVLCGTSGPLAVGDRAKPCVAIQAGGALYLVDIGPEATENLMLWRLPLAPARAVFITHLVISGDTVKWPPLADASKGADVLIHEAQNSDMTGQLSRALAGSGLPRVASIMEDTLSYHTTPVEAAEIAKAAGVKALVLYHLTQAGLPFFTPEAFTRGVDAIGFGNWRLARDGMTIELPVGSTEIRFGQF